jgi:hypothetical protein
MVGALLWSEAREQSADALPSGLDSSLGASGSDGPSDGVALVAAEIVEDDDVAWLERRHQYLLDIGQEALAVDRPVDDARGVDAVMAQSGEEGERVPAAMRGLGDQPGAPRGAPVAACHVGFGPGLVDEDQSLRVNPALILLPLSPPPRDVGTILLAGVQAFF